MSAQMREDPGRHRPLRRWRALLRGPAPRFGCEQRSRADFRACRFQIRRRSGPLRLVAGTPVLDEGAGPGASFSRGRPQGERQVRARLFLGGGRTVSVRSGRTVSVGSGRVLRSRPSRGTPSRPSRRSRASCAGPTRGAPGASCPRVRRAYRAARAANLATAARDRTSSRSATKVYWVSPRKTRSILSPSRTRGFHCTFALGRARSSVGTAVTES